METRGNRFKLITSSDELLKISRHSNRFLTFKIAIRRFFKR